LHPGVPKPLIPVAGRAFLEWLCRYWTRAGVREFVLSLGHLADVAEREIAHWEPTRARLRTVREQTPLGTGGAIRFAAAAAPEADPLLVLNGDSMVVGDLSPIWKLLEQADTDGVIVGVGMADASRFGTLRIDAQGLLTGFEEKRPGAGWINAGIYLLRRELLELFPASAPLSMECDVFPALLAAGKRLRVLRVDGDFIDIGTPEALARAADFITRHEKEFGS
jgi:NDP-sugar pyrophosphorylase family protein